jgi:alkylation response protein AidB-like acyl-CoA dehydrogenase
MYADYFTTAVRTGGDGMGGISLLLIEKSMPGVHCSRLATTGWLSSATTLVRFENVRVPVKNLIGEENAGFMAIMLNFNQERMGGIIASARYSRVLLTEAAKYARQRITFGKPLMSHQVIRASLGEMARQVEALQALTDELAWQVETMAPIRAILGPRIALAKVQGTRLMEFCAREAAQIFGGNSLPAPGHRLGRGANWTRGARDGDRRRLGESHVGFCDSCIETLMKKEIPLLWFNSSRFDFQMFPLLKLHSIDANNQSKSRRAPNWRQDR